MKTLQERLQEVNLKVESLVSLGDNIGDQAEKLADYVAEAKGGQICPMPFEQNNLNRICGEVLTNRDALDQYGKNGETYCNNSDIYSMTDNAVEQILSRAKRNRDQL